jgi:hypothetical protein
MSLVPKVDDAFWPQFVADVTSMGRDPTDLAKVLFAESGLDPTSINWRHVTNPVTKKWEPHKPPIADAAGLNQMTGAAMQPWSNDIAEAFAALSASEQWRTKSWPFLKTWMEKNPKAISARDLYWLNIQPGKFVPDSPDDYLIPGSHDAADSNLFFKDPASGLIRVGLFQTFLDKNLNDPRWKLIVSAIAQATDPIGAAKLLAFKAMRSGYVTQADKRKKALLFGGAVFTTAVLVAAAYLAAGGTIPWRR